MEEGEALKYTHETRDKTHVQGKLFQVQNTTEETDLQEEGKLINQLQDLMS